MAMSTVTTDMMSLNLPANVRIYCIHGSSVNFFVNMTMMI